MNPWLEEKITRPIVWLTKFLRWIADRLAYEEWEQESGCTNPWHHPQRNGRILLPFCPSCSKTFEHIESEDCWCEPTVDDYDGVKHIIHRAREQAT